jgi:hypothetical protein
MFVAAVFKIAPMSFTMLAAVVGCVTIIHTMSARKRNPTILLMAYHRSTPVGGTLTPICTARTGSAVGVRVRRKAGWLPQAQEDLESWLAGDREPGTTEQVLFNPAQVPTTRYRYRGAAIPAAWPVTG